MGDVIDIFGTGKSKTDEGMIQKRLETLLLEHRAIDRVIMKSESNHNLLEYKRLKKKKLFLKEQIAKLKSLLHSDIIA